MQAVVLPDCPPPYFALAHSMGGAVLLRVAHSGQRWFERMVLVAPLIDMPEGRAPRGSYVSLMQDAAHRGSWATARSRQQFDRARASRFPRNPLTTDP